MLSDEIVIEHRAGGAVFRSQQQMTERLEQGQIAVDPNGQMTVRQGRTLQQPKR